MFRYPIGVHDMMVFGCGDKSIELKRCDDIEKQLAEHRLYANVSRHTLFDKKMYIVFFNDDNGGEYPSIGKIADALEIPNSWVSLYEVTANNTQYAVLEKELNGKHKNSDGRLEWVEPFDFYKAVNSGNPNERINKQLKSCRRVVSCYKDKGIILIDCPLSSKCVANNLGICEDSVIDASCTLKESGITHIIIVEED